MNLWEVGELLGATGELWELLGTPRSFWEPPGKRVKVYPWVWPFREFVAFNRLQISNFFGN